MKGCFILALFLIFSGSPAQANPTKNLFTAIESINHEAIKQALLNGANVRARNDQGESVLHVCARVGDAVPFAELLDLGADINARNDFGQTPLHVAAAYGNEAEVRALVALNANLFATDKTGMSALQTAAENKEWSIVEFLLASIEVARKREGPPSIFRSPAMLIPAGLLLIAGIGYMKSQGEQ